MWGDLERSNNFDASDPLASLLLQVTGPIHIPWDDPIWEELLYGYNVWVHFDAPPPHLLSIQVDDDGHGDEDETDEYDDDYNGVQEEEPFEYEDNNNTAYRQQQKYGSMSYVTSFMIRVCQSTIRHSARTSNLASLTIHVTQTIRDLTKNIQDVTPSTANNYINDSMRRTADTARSSTPSKIVYLHQSNNNSDLKLSENNNPSYDAFSNRITLVGKCRAAAGSLNLLRILVHAVIGHDNLPETHRNQEQQKNDSFEDRKPSARLNDPIKEYFTYNSRDRTSAIMLLRRQLIGDTVASANTMDIDVGCDLVASLLELIQCAAPILPTTWNDAPELYDAIVLSFHLLLVLLSTQLYRPMVSSHQHKMADNNGDDSNMGYFWNILLDQARVNTNKGVRNNEVQPLPWSVTQLLAVLLQWHVDRPAPPYKSIQYHRTQLMQQIVGNLLNHPTMQRHHQERTPPYASMKIGSDGLYEGYSIVQSCAPPTSPNRPHSTLVSNGNGSMDSGPNNSSTGNLFGQSSHDFSDTKGNRRNIIDLSSNLLSLPLRFLNLVIGILAGQASSGGVSNAHNQQMALLLQLQQVQIKKRLREQSNSSRNLTKDIVLITDSPIADLAVSILLLLCNNERYSSHHSADDNDYANGDCTTTSPEIDSLIYAPNPFRRVLSQLVDNRWYDMSPKTDFTLDSRQTSPDESHIEQSFLPTGVPLNGSITGSQAIDAGSTENNVGLIVERLPVNFEALFASFGRTVHNEPGAMFLYTLLQVSPAFAQSLAVRSDLDTIVLPMLRTLYFSTALKMFTSGSPMKASVTPSPATKSSTTTTSSSLSPEHILQQPLLTQDDKGPISTHNLPFRSQSQLYVIVILFLMFSQDPSFGSDAFRRIELSSVGWYKERHLKNINLGSVLILCMLRSLVFNLNRLRDPFLLSNCCAVLMNLSPSAANIQDYAASRLVSVTVSFLKRYATLRKQYPKETEENDEKMTTSLAQHGEATRTLLHLIKHGLNVKNIAQNIHLVYAVAYHNTEWERYFTERGCPFRKAEVNRIKTVAATATSILVRSNQTYSATKAFQILSDNIGLLRDVVVKEKTSPRRLPKSVTENPNQENQTFNQEDEFVFCYEEETDPEVFFVPYIWDIIVSTITASSIEWHKKSIKVFQLQAIDESEDVIDENNEEDEQRENVIPQFARDVFDIV